VKFFDEMKIYTNYFTTSKSSATSIIHDLNNISSLGELEEQLSTSNIRPDLSGIEGTRLHMENDHDEDTGCHGMLPRPPMTCDIRAQIP
jgi:hypothetical protein